MVLNVVPLFCFCKAFFWGSPKTLRFCFPLIRFRPLTIVGLSKLAEADFFHMCTSKHKRGVWASCFSKYSPSYNVEYVWICMRIFEVWVWHPKYCACFVERGSAKLTLPPIMIFWKNVSLEGVLNLKNAIFGSVNHSCRWRWYLQCSSFLKKIVEEAVRILRCTPPKLTVEKWMLFTVIGILVSSAH